MCVCVCRMKISDRSELVNERCCTVNLQYFQLEYAKVEFPALCKNELSFSHTVRCLTVERFNVLMNIENANYEYPACCTMMVLHSLIRDRYYASVNSYSCECQCIDIV